ncbi:helix-turn-helix transcriptional regulator [uncultured Cohaesibacter sp.]|uniref:helix-turn-helix domain-containing protein n=1 Tax=uncultured Cohaesibacter sp. TaxID=1002546 RepID=UPI0029C6D787|nr:helix-turn-helix transcriptional regulator [uncultured Cohaesibacter sp.]
MSAQQFRAWRREMGLKQKDAADLLGLKKRMIQYYEKGNRDGKSVTIPKSVRLACYALTIGISDFDGIKVSNFDPSKFKDREKEEDNSEATTDLVSPESEIERESA